MTAPFAMITFFEADTAFEFSAPLTYDQFQAQLDDLLNVESTFYAIKVSGSFSYLQRRSVSKQSKPYPDLLEAVANQSVYEEHDADFTLVGYRIPGYMQELNTPGYHLHCIDSSRSKGGHVLDFILSDVKVEIDYTGDYYMINSN